MHNIGPEIRRIAARLEAAENKRKQASAFIKSSFPGLLRKAGGDIPDSFRVAAVDGGLIKKSFHGFDCALVRAAGVCMSYEKGKLSGVKYWPSKAPTPVPKVFEALSDIDWAYLSSLVRIESEIDVVLECLERFKPDILMMDGSIVPHYSDRPASGKSEAYGIYSRVIEKYRRLYSRIVGSGTMLAGIVEDSRSTRFCTMLRDEVAPKSGKELPPEIAACLGSSRDTNLLFSALEVGEMTAPFPYASSVSGHNILKDMGEHASRVSTFYIRTAKLDRPIKVDFLGGDDRMLAPVLMEVASQHPSYGLPVPIIEADNVAKLSEDDMDRLYSLIVSETGNLPSAMRLRREQRPF